MSIDTEFTATEIARDVRAGVRSASEVIEITLARIAAFNPSIKAFCEVRATAARTAAAEIDAQVARGLDPGRLAGVPVAVKDVLWEAGIEATNGSRSLIGHFPSQTCAAVERLIAAGAVIVGRTNQPEFCYAGHCRNDLFGATSNPWNLTRTPGGSSGGSAAAVASRMCPVALGTDCGGSIRVPASFCGVVGLKATFGLVPREPGFPGWLSINHVGPIAATVEDVALVLSVIGGPDLRDPLSLPVSPIGAAAPQVDRRRFDGLRIAASADLGHARVSGPIRTAFDEAVEVIRGLGGNVEFAHPRLPSSADLWYLLAGADAAASEGPLLATGSVGGEAADMIHAGEQWSGADYARARQAQHALAAQWERFMDTYDLLFTPTMECSAFAGTLDSPGIIDGIAPRDPYGDWCLLCLPADLSGQPAISVPMGVDADGMPMGLQIIGRRGADELLIEAAVAWQHAVPSACASARCPPREPTGASDDLRYGACAAGGQVRVGGEAFSIRRATFPSAGEMLIELEALDGMVSKRTIRAESIP